MPSTSVSSSIRGRGTSSVGRGGLFGRTSQHLRPITHHSMSNGDTNTSQIDWIPIFAQIESEINRISLVHGLNSQEVRKQYVFATLSVQPLFTSNHYETLPVHPTLVPAELPLNPVVSTAQLVPTEPLPTEQNHSIPKKKQYSCDLEAVLEGDGLSDCEEEDVIDISPKVKEKDISLQKGSALFVSHQPPVTEPFELGFVRADQYIQSEQINYDHLINVRLTRVESLDEIYFVCLGNAGPKMYESEYHEVLESIESLTSTEATIGTPCMVYCHLDFDTKEQSSGRFGWARGVIEKINSDGSPDVFLVDYGRMASGMFTLDDLKPVPDEIAKQPPIAYCASISNREYIKAFTMALDVRKVNGISDLLSADCICRIKLSRPFGRMENKVQIVDLLVDGVSFDAICYNLLDDQPSESKPTTSMSVSSHQRGVVRPMRGRVMGFGHALPVVKKTLACGGGDNTSSSRAISDDDHDERMSIPEMPPERYAAIGQWLQTVDGDKLNESMQSDDTLKKENWD